MVVERYGSARADMEPLCAARRGELPPAPKKPSLAVANPKLTVGKTGNVTGTADPGCTVCVEIAGEEFSAVADKSGRFSVPVTLSENTPAGEMPLTCYAVSPEGDF